MLASAHPRTGWPHLPTVMAEHEVRAVPRIASIAFLLLLALASPTRATTYRVGPGQPLATPSNVPWESLVAGDSVLIFPNGSAYHDKWVICRVGNSSAPIVVHGVPDAGGALPVIDGANAVTRTPLDFWNEERGVIKIGGANVPPDAMPAWIVVENLEIRGARSGNSFTGRNGASSYATNASAIYVEKGTHVTIRNCHLHDCGNGFFCASGTSELLVEKNWIEGNGNVGSIYEHNNYTEAAGATFQFNHFGPLLAGASGNNLKDRSAGCVIRYNWIEGGNRQLDLVESDFATLVNDPRYHSTFVYGNVLLETGDDGNSQIAHYGGDGSNTANYRKGTLWFHFNTVVSRRTGNTTLLRLSTASESADVRDNIVFVTASGSHLALLDQAGTLVATRNWMKTGWAASFSGGAVTDGGQVTGSDPGFTNAGADAFELAPTSPCRDTAVALAAACVPDHVPVFEYVKHQSSRARTQDGKPDLGAYEFASTAGVPVAFDGPSRVVATPNPSTGAFEIRAAGVLAAVPGWPVEILDLGGRRVAWLHEAAPGLWRWKPEAGLGSGIYFARINGSVEKLVRIR